MQIASYFKMQYYSCKNVSLESVSLVHGVDSLPHFPVSERTYYSYKNTSVRSIRGVCIRIFVKDNLYSAMISFVNHLQLTS